MNRIARFVPALAWAGLIFFLSSQPRLPDLPVTFDGVDKCAHAFVYGVLAVLVAFGIGPRKRKALLIGVIAASLYGMSDEVHQMFVPNRTPDVLDWIADTLGATLAVLGWHWWLTKETTRAQNV